MLKIKHIEDIKIDLISDYLRIPSVNKEEDDKRILRLKELMKVFNKKSKNYIVRNGK